MLNVHFNRSSDRSMEVKLTDPALLGNDDRPIDGPTDRRADKKFHFQ